MSFLNDYVVNNKTKLLLNVEKQGLNYLIENTSEIDREWNFTKNGVFRWFNRMDLNEYTKVEKNVSVGFHLNKQYCFTYNPDFNRLEFNLLSYLFHINPNSTEIFFKEQFWIGFYLIHELDHYFYCRDHGGIRLDEKEGKEWNDEHEKALEIRALTAQMNYIEKLRFMIPSDFNLLKYIDGGRPVKCPNKRRNLLRDLRTFVERELVNVRRGIDVYRDNANKNAFETSMKLGKILRVTIDQSEDELYERVVIPF